MWRDETKPEDLETTSGTTNSTARTRGRGPVQRARDNSGVRNRTKGAVVAREFGVLWMNVDSLGKAAYRYKENTQNM